MSFGTKVNTDGTFETVQQTAAELAEIAAMPPLPVEVRREPFRLQILALEAGQARAVREAALGLAGAQDRLIALDAQIAAIRAQMMAVV